MIPDYTPKTGKIEWHITYRCNLTCRACSRCSWMSQPHTRDMTLEDAEECIRQANAIGWKDMPGPGNGAEPPRILIIGGEPTLHPQFMKFVKLARDWTGTYVEIYSNGLTEETQILLSEARQRYNASINRDGFKRAAREKPQDGGQLWSMETYVSPTEADLSLTVCYCHCFRICGIGFDASGFSPCPIGLTISKILGVDGVTKNLADLWDKEKAYKLTTEICRHCGYEGQYRYGPVQLLDKFREYADKQPKIRGAPVSSVWQRAFEKHGITQ